jgi:hypothetical protein
MLSLRINSIGGGNHQMDRRPVAGIHGLSLLAAFLAVMLPAGCSATSGRHEPIAPSLRLATLNLAHGRALSVSQFRVPPDRVRANIDACADAIVRDDPDVIALQEADVPSAW